MAKYNKFCTRLAKLLGVATLAFAPTVLAAQEVTIRLGHVLAETHNWHRAATGFAEDVAKGTDGRVAVEVFSGGQLGTEKEAVEGLQFGSVQAGVIGTGSFQFLEPKLGILEMPYAWTSREQAFAALDGDLGEHLAGLLADKGIVVLSWWELGFRNVTNNKGPINTPADLAGLKIRVTPDPVRLRTFELLGAEPAPLAFGELYTALQQGVFDAQENPLSVIESASFFEVQKFISMTQHIWGASALVMAKTVFDKLSDADKEVVMEAAGSWGQKQRELVASEDADLIASLKEHGMQFNEVDKAPFVAAVQPIWDQQADVYGAELMTLIEGYRK